ncbi:MAG TPA: class I SAM-dependent methyltransferase, partial [Epulopiscium sp.]|nr:class I SAM-dependent methyltransferase [Candidatus Epulonipiscium sp.]
MEFTGERFIPDLGYESELGTEHIQRYKSINKLVKDKIVLDAACGEGYGTDILSQHAKKVYGIDISVKAIEEAKIKYINSNIEFKEASIAKLELPDDSIDVVVSFETIEHVGEEIQEEFLKEINRVLKTDGLLVISTPNKEIYTDTFNYSNEFHVKEFYPEEFRLFLEKYFKNVKFYNQTVEANSLIVEENAKIISILNNDLSLKSKYIIAVCSNEEISKDMSINTMIVDTQEKYLNNIKRIISLQEELEKLSLWGQKLDKESQVYITNIKQFKDDIKLKIDENTVLNKTIYNKEDELQEIKKNKEHEISELIKAKDHERNELIKAKDHEINELNKAKDHEINEL